MRIKKISPKQYKILTWWNDTSPYRDCNAIICDGAVRSGKTLFMGLSFIFWAMSRYTGMQFGICGKTVTSMRRNVISVILPILRQFGFICNEKISRGMLSISYNGRENTFYYFGGRDESSAALIQGVTFAGVLLDEVALMPQSFVEQTCARCSVEGSKLWFNCNPESPEHWFYREWILECDKKKAYHLHLTMADNPALSERIRARYETMYSGVFYKRFILGQWVMAEGRVYDFYNDDYVRPVPKVEFESWYISCDYGTVNPASFGLWGLYEGKWFRTDEFYFDSRKYGYQMTDEEYAEQLEKLAANNKINAVVVDPSAASFIEVLSRRGFRVIKAKNDVLGGIRVTADLLKSGEIVICDTCRDAIREFYMYVWDTKAKGDAVTKQNDHAMDDIRYFAYTIVRRENDSFAAIAVER